MTGHTSHEEIGLPQENRSTDSESATKFPTPKSGVVQDSPGTSSTNTEGEGLLDEHGNLKKPDSNVLGAADEE